MYYASFPDTWCNSELHRGVYGIPVWSPSLHRETPDDIYVQHLLLLQVRLAPVFAKAAASESTATHISV